MSYPGKASATSSRQSLETLVEHGENDDIAVSTGGKGSCKGDRGSLDSEPLCRKRLPGPVVGKQTMQSSASSDASDKDRAIKSSFKAQLSRSFFQSRSRSWSSTSVDGGSPSPSKSRLGTVPVEDPITHESVVNSRVLLLYTGGALGWKVDPADLEGK